VEINSETANTLKLRDGQEVWIESPFQKIKAKLKWSERDSPRSGGDSHGSGAFFLWEMAKGIGVNPNEIIGVDYDHLSGQSAFFNTRVRVYKA